MKYENISKKMDSLMRATIGCMKQLEYALTLLFSPKTSEAKTCFLGMLTPRCTYLA